MLLWLRRVALVAIIASVFLLGFFVGRHSVTRGTRFQQEQWAIDVATDYLHKNGISTSGCDPSAYEIYNGYRVYFAPPSPPLGYARTGGDIQVIVGIDGTIIQALRGQ